MNRLQMIEQLFNNDKDHPLTEPERSSTKMARALEAALHKDIKPVIQQYEEGLLSTAEFVGKIYLICDEEIPL